LGLTHNSSYAPMLRRIADTDEISALRVLADVVEPVKGYAREETSPAEPTSLMPLNRLVDAARPESSTARHFAGLVDSLLAGSADVSTKAEIRKWLTLWKNNDSKLAPLETQSFLLKEVAPLSQNLSTLAASGLEAMDYLDRGERPSDDWKTQQLVAVKQARESKAQLLIMIGPSIQRLIDPAAPIETPAKIGH
jgi:hexosaminidase